MVKDQYIEELNIKKLLKEGSKGDDVEKVQEWLNLWRMTEPKWQHRVSVDGDYGPQTAAVIREFQSFTNIPTDGIVGDQTFGVLTQPMIKAFSRIDGDDLRTLIVKYAEQQLRSNPKELFGRNEGPWVRAFMDGHEGQLWAWCMGFVQTVLDQAFTSLGGSTFISLMPKSYSCDKIGNHGVTKKKLRRSATIRINPAHIEAGDVFLNVKTQTDWVHTGIIVGVEGDWIYTIEGNTNDEGSREGYEVSRRMRNFQKHKIDVFKVT